MCLGIKTLIYHWYRSFEWASLIHSGLLLFFRLIFDQGVCFRVCKFSLALYFLGYVSGIYDGHPYTFYPRVPPQIIIGSPL